MTFETFVLNFNSLSGQLRSADVPPPSRKDEQIDFLTALVGQSSQGRTPTLPRDKRDKMAILLWNAGLSQGRVPICPGEGSRLSQGRFLFVLDTVPPKMFMFIGFFLPDLHLRLEPPCPQNGKRTYI